MPNIVEIVALWPIFRFCESASNHDDDRIGHNGRALMASFQILRAIMIMIAKMYYGRFWRSFHILRAIMIMIG